MFPEEIKFFNFLKSKGLKFTRERQLILKEIFSMHKHFDAEQLYDKIKRARGDVSRATIYRTLPLLLEANLIKETLRCQNKIRYEHIFGHLHHDHLICIKCGKIIEFNENRISNLVKLICKKYHFDLKEYRLGIKGLCKSCKKKKS